MMKIGGALKNQPTNNGIAADREAGHRENIER